MANESMRYDIVLGFKADVESAKKQLYDLQQNIEKITSKDFSLNFKTGDIKAGIVDLDNQLIILQKSLAKSMNLDTGKINLNKLIAETKAYGININEVTGYLAGMGAEGKESLSIISKLIAEGDAKAINFNKSIQRMGEQLVRTAKIQLSYAVLDQFTGVFRDSYNYAQELNKSLNNIRIVTNKSKTDMSKFAIEANKAAKALSTTTTAYTDAALIYYQQGLNDDAVKERTDATVKLANVTGQSASEVSSYMTAIWNNYDNGSKSLEYYADVITALGAATASSSEEIATGLSQFSAVANTVGLSYEYASSALATVVAQTRLSADTVGTSFKTIFARLQSLNLGETLDDDTTLTKYTKAMDKVGVSIKNQDGTLKSMDSILDSLGTKWSQLSQEQKNGLAYTVAGARQYTNFIALMDNWQQMQANVSIAEASEGTLTRQQQIYEESWEAANKRLKASFESIYDTIINDDAFIFLTNTLSKLVDLINEVIKGFGGFEGTLGLLSSTVLKLFKTPIDNWLRGVISTVNQAYSLANKQGEKLKEENYEASLKGEDFYSAIGVTDLGDEYIKEIRRINAIREEQLKNNSINQKEINTQYDNLIEQVYDRFSYIKKWQDKSAELLTNDQYNASYKNFLYDQSVAANNNLSLKQLKDWFNTSESVDESSKNKFNDIIQNTSDETKQLKEINELKNKILSNDDLWTSTISILKDTSEEKVKYIKSLLEDTNIKLEGEFRTYLESIIQEENSKIDYLNESYRNYEETLRPANDENITTSINDENITPVADYESSSISEYLTRIVDLLNIIADNKQVTTTPVPEDQTTTTLPAKGQTTETPVPESNATNIPTPENQSPDTAIIENHTNDTTITADNTKLENHTKDTTITADNSILKNDTKNTNTPTDDSNNGTDKITNPEIKSDRKLKKLRETNKKEQQNFNFLTANKQLKNIKEKGGDELYNKFKKELKQLKVNQNRTTDLFADNELAFNRKAFSTSTNNLNKESIQLLKEYNDLALQTYNQEHENSKIEVTNAEKRIDGYQKLASNITNVSEVLMSSIALSSTFDNILNDIQNKNFDNLAGDFTALSMTLANNANSVLQLKKLMGEKWPFPAGEKITTTIGNLVKHPIASLKSGLSSISSLFTSIGATGTGVFASLSAGAKALTASLMDVLWPIILVQGTLWAIKKIWSGISEAIENADPAKRLQKLQNATEDLKTKADEAAKAYENISSTLNGLDTAANKIENLTKDTLEWKNAVADNNKQVLELLSTYNMLDPKYLDDSGDYYKLTELAQREIQNRAYQEKQSSNALYLLSLAKTKEAEYELSESDTKRANQEEFSKKIKLTTTTTKSEHWQDSESGPIDGGMTSSKITTDNTSVIPSNPGNTYDDSIKSNSVYDAIIKALEKDNDSQFKDLAEFTRALTETTDLDEATITELGEQLFPNDVKDEILVAMEEEQQSRNKNTEAIDLLTKEAGKSLFELDFANLGISEEVWNDPEFQKFYKGKQEEAEKTVGNSQFWASRDKEEEVAALFGAAGAIYDDQTKSWRVNQQDYSLAEIALKAEQNFLLNDEEITTKAIEIQDRKGYQRPLKSLNSSTDGSVEKDIEAWKLDKNAIEGATEALYKLYEAQGMTEDQAKRIVVANEKLNAAYSDLISNFKNYQTAIKDNEKYSAEYQTAMAALKKDAAALVDVNEDLINEDFLANEENLKLLEKFQYGDMAAGEEFQKRLSYNLEFDLSEESKAKVTSALDEFYAETANEPLEIGMTLDSTPALQQLYDTYDKMIKSGEMTAEEVSAALSSIGFEPEIVWEEATAEYLQSINYAGAVRLRTGGDEQEISDFTSLADIDGKQKVTYPVIKPKDSTYRGSPKHVISNTNKQKAAKNAASSNKPKTKNVDDEKKRYYEINQQLERLNDELNKITKAKDRAFGKEKLGYLDQEINKYKDLEKAQQKYLDEVNNYLSSDISKLAAYGAQFNDDGTLANYEELISKQVAQYNATANAENSNADEVYSNFTKALSNYEDSLSKSREVLNQLIEYQNQIYDLKLEKIVYKVEYKVEINDKDLERLEWLLSNISDKAFKSAESIALMSKQMADYQSSFETVNKGIDEWFANHTEISAEMKDAFLNGTLSADELASKLNTLTEAEKEQLYNWSSQLMQLVDNMEQVKQAIQDQLLKSFDDFTEKIDEQTNRLSTLNQIMSSYIEIAKLVGKENLGVSNELMKQMRQSTIDLSTQQINIMRKEYEAAKEELDKLMATPGVEPETIAQAKQRVSEIYANLLSQTQETVSAIQQMFADTMQDIADDFSKRMGGLYGSISELQLAYDRQKDLNEGYLETYQKSYELAKLTREINNSINDTDSLKGKQLLLSLEDEITQRQADRTKMSEYELNFLQKKYELYQAQIALEEAQNAKSQVRMTRDANGNMSYTYTADQEAIDKAEQGYNDALYNLMNLNQEQLQANQEKILSIVSEYYQNLIDLGYDQEEAAALANEHYQTLMAQAREEMDLTLGHASWIVEEMGVEEDLLIDKFDETVLAHITGTTTMEEYIDNWEAAVAAAISATNTNYQEFQSNLTSCLETAELDSQAFADAVDADMSEVNDALIETENETDKLVDTFKSDFDKALMHVKDFDSQYAKFLENMRKNTNTLVQALNNLIKGFAELDGRAANVISTSQSKISAAEVELETQSNGSGTPKEQGGGGADEYTFYFGNEPLGKGKLTEKSKFYGILASKTGIPTINGAHYITTYPDGPIYVYTDRLGNKKITRNNPVIEENGSVMNIKQFNTGGYTGDWTSNEGRLAILDKKELVLNADDTSNILEVVNIVRNLADTISNLTYRDKMESLLNNIRNIYDHIYDNIKIENSQNMDQYITIQADFPSVSSQVEIEAAFDNILLHASQYANRKA